MAVVPRPDAVAWLESWDRQQERYLPDREERLWFLIGMVTAAPLTEELRVLDLACGPGSLTQRLVAARPDAEIVAVDLDPVLLTIYRSVHPKITVVEGDLRREDWMEAIAGDFDAVMTATALHWMTGPQIRRVYIELARMLRPGGVFVNADHAPLDGTPELARRCSNIFDQETQSLSADRHDWESWWSEVAQHPTLGRLLPERNRRFADRGDEFAPSADWHISALADAGFVEQNVVWRRGRDAIIAAVK